MATSKILLHLLHRGLTTTQEDISQRYRDIAIHDVLSAGAGVETRRKICGHILHAKRQPRNRQENTRLVTKTARGNQQFSTNYYRIFYIRFETTLALVVVKIGMEALSLHLEKSLGIGKPLILLNPSCVTYWNGLPVITSPHPFLPVASPIIPVIDVVPTGQISGGQMKSFCIEVDKINVSDVDFQQGCTHDFCDSRYGIDCPGSCSVGKLMVPQLKFSVAGITAGWVPYKSRSLGLSVFESKALVIPTCPASNFLEMADFLEDALKAHTRFRITCWYKPAVRDGDIVTDDFKLHVSSLEILDTPLPSYVAGGRHINLPQQVRMFSSHTERQPLTTLPDQRPSGSGESSHSRPSDTQEDQRKKAPRLDKTVDDPANVVSGATVEKE